MRVGLICLSLLALSACSSDLSPEARSVQQIFVGDTTGCSSLGPVSVSKPTGASGSQDVEGAFDLVRNETAARGGNAFVAMIVNITGEGVAIEADAYNCP